jgi:hypothetical protein
MANDKRNGESPDPKPRGGRRSGQKREVSAASLANLKFWPKGVSGNPSGKSKSLNDIMRLARSHAPKAIERLRSIMMDPKAAHRDVIQAAIALLDRGCGKPVTPVYRGGTNLPIEMIEGGGDGEVTALLRSAGKGVDGAYRRALQAELTRLDDEEAQARAAQRDEVDEAREAMRRGEEVSPLMRMLIEVKDSTE